MITTPFRRQTHHVIRPTPGGVPELGALGGACSRLGTILDVGLADSAAQTVAGDVGVRGDLLDGLVGFTVAGDADDVVAKLLRKGLGHGVHPSSDASQRHRSDATYPCNSTAAQTNTMKP